MCRRFVVTFIFIFCPLQAFSAETDADLSKQVRELARQVKALRDEVSRLQQEQQNPQPGFDSVKIEDYDSAASASASVNLDSDELPSLDDEQDSHVLANPWWKNVQINGFGAAGFYDTGAAGTRDDGGFEVKEATLFIEADVWENAGLFVELQTNRLGDDGSKFTRTGEVYIHLRDLQLAENTSIGLKLGRFDIPFGEEYLWQDAIDNPLITNSAIYPYGWDEGVLVYSQWGGVNWIAAITDGTDARSEEENADKAFNLKVYGNPTDHLSVSASYMHDGDGSKSAIEFGGSHFEPVIDSGVGSSTSEEVGSSLFEANAKYRFLLADMQAYIALSAGLAKQDDDDSFFDRDFRWFSVEPYLQINNQWYTVLRYSEIGTYDDDEGYHFDGKTFAGGNSTLGFDTERFRRLGIGIGWRPNPHLLTKLEVGRDWFDVIDASPLSTNNGDRNFIGLEMAVGF
ncbi:MAG: hypothetical protein ACR2PS_08155 [Pseudomonadales bacterium]